MRISSLSYGISLKIQQNIAVASNFGHLSSRLRAPVCDIMTPGRDEKETVILHYDGGPKKKLLKYQ